jgi:hypothetical protein
LVLMHPESKIEKMKTPVNQRVSLHALK